MTRDELYHQFGPLLIEALVDILLEEITELAVKSKTMAKTKQQVMDAVDVKFKSFSKYDWMNRVD